MKMSNVDEECEVDGVPVSALLAEERVNRYGSVPDLDDEELATPEELERQVMREQWGAILALPVRRRGGWIQPNIGEDGQVDFGAFATVDFARTVPEFDKARYKADRLREELRDVLIMMSPLNERLPKARFRVLKLLRTGVIGLEDIESVDMYLLAKMYMRARRIQDEIRQLRKASRAKVRRELAAVLV